MKISRIIEEANELADVREFSLSWDDCYDYLHKLGYDVKVEVSETI